MTVAPATIGCPDADALALPDHQHLVENNFCAHVRRYLFYLEFFAGGNLVLLAAGFYDRVHGEYSAIVESSLPRSGAAGAAPRTLRPPAARTAASKLPPRTAGESLEL
ncbi:MAG: hypothetical protein V9E94_14820 [Microthrixaceae bacterium]